MAAILADEDGATLKHCAEPDMGDNRLKALASDPGHLEAWCLLSTRPLPWPAPESLPLKFVAQT